MKIKEVIYQTPEMSEEKLLSLIDKHSDYLKKDTIKRLKEIHGHNIPLQNIILNEWDLIQDKNSYLSKSQREEICTLTSVCLVGMTKGETNDTKESIS